MKEIKISSNRIHNAYLLLGQEEEDLVNMANHFAITLLSEEKHFQEKGFATKEQYRENVALRVEKGEHPDCIVVDFQEKAGGGKKSSISIEQIRTEVKGTADISPKEGAFCFFPCFCLRRHLLSSQYRI